MVYIVACMSEYETGFGLVIGFIGFELVNRFIEHLQVVTTSNYSFIANTHIQQFTTVTTKSSQSAVSSPVVAW
jgi:hypothetical protein